MKPEEVKIGGTYYLLPLDQVMVLEKRYKELGYYEDTKLALHPQKQRLCDGKTPVIIKDNSYGEKGKCIIFDPETQTRWIAMSEWLLKEPYTPKPVEPKKPKSNIRFIRGV